MASILQQLKPTSKYIDRRTFPTYDDAKNALHKSDTVYVGNLTFYATEPQISAFFSSCGEVRQIFMGLNRVSRTCGFAFVQYFTHEAAKLAVDMLNNAKFDERIIKVEMDPGYKDGRQWGRGEDRWTHQTTIVLSLTLGEAVGERMATVTEDANGEDMGGARKTCKYHFCICS